jgi:glycosyltransferase involved in cell wall biosynthesis
MLKVLVVAQTPPPYGGAPIMVQNFLRCKWSDIQLVHVRMKFSAGPREEGHVRLAKIASLIALVLRIAFWRLVSGARILYYTPGGPQRVPMWRDIFILSSTRWLFRYTVLHYHLGGVSQLYPQLSRWQQWLFRLAYFHADTAVRISELNPEDGKRLCAKREYVIPNGIEDPCPDALDGGPKAETASSEPLRILFVSNLRETKGVLVLLEAAGKLLARGIPLKLEIMGQWQNDEIAAKAKRRLAELGLEDNVRFLGVQIGEPKFAAFRRAHVFCFPSFFEAETFGVVLVEAMACAIPVVATRWRGIPSVVDDGITGFLVEPRNDLAVADRLAQLAYDPDLRERLGRAGREKFEQLFTHHVFAQRMRRMLLETAGVAAAKRADEVPETMTAIPLEQRSVA